MNSLKIKVALFVLLINTISIIVFKNFNIISVLILINYIGRLFFIILFLRTLSSLIFLFQLFNARILKFLGEFHNQSLLQVKLLKDGIQLIIGVAHLSLDLHLPQVKLLALHPPQLPQLFPLRLEHLDGLQHILLAPILVPQRLHRLGIKFLAVVVIIVSFCMFRVAFGFEVKGSAFFV